MEAAMICFCLQYIAASRLINVVISAKWKEADAVAVPTPMVSADRMDMNDSFGDRLLCNTGPRQSISLSLRWPHFQELPSVFPGKAYVYTNKSPFEQSIILVSQKQL